jgi:hypothetical protein
MQYPVSREGKRVTLLACIAHYGSHTRTAVAIRRKTYDDDLGMYGLTREKIDVHHQAKWYIDRNIFED